MTIRVTVTDLHVSGSGVVVPAVRDELTIDVSGAGPVSQTGDPKVEPEISGSGTAVERSSRGGGPGRRPGRTPSPGSPAEPTNCP